MHFPPELYSCVLDEQPDHLVPRSLSHRRPASGKALVVNPEYWPTESGPPHGAIPDTVEETSFAPFDSAVWVREPETGMVLPFWAGPELTVILSRLRPDEPCPSDLSLEMCQELEHAGILVGENLLQQRRRINEYLSGCAEQFRERGYVPVRRLIHPFHVSGLRRYYRRLVRTGKFILGDAQTPHRYIAHNEPIARFFHAQLANVVSSIVGVPVKPSYVYVASYQDGSTLEKHTDREQCEFSVTYCLDYSPEPVRETAWPIHLEAPSADVTVYQAIGDALLYRGRQIPHYRNPIPAKHTSTSIFFHYVDSSFQGQLT